jgi:hypothetical protein
MAVNKTQIEYWHEKLKKRKATLYIKPTRHVHESGYRTFEVGYFEIGKNRKLKNKLVLGEYSDHINLDYLTTLLENKAIPLNMDLTLDGYIRIWNYDGEGNELKWEWDTSFALSTMTITTFKNDATKSERLNRLTRLTNK